MKTSISVFLLALVATYLAVSSAQAEPQSYWSWLLSLQRQNEIAPITDKGYEEKCGACHFAYQPGWLPEASWRRLMDVEALENHFGLNVELNQPTRTSLLDYMVANSADKSRYKRSKKIMVSLAEGEAPLRITETPYIQSKHKGVYDDVVTRSLEIESLRHCDKCHQKAREADFDDDTVFIPGHGYNSW